MAVDGVKMGRQQNAPAWFAARREADQQVGAVGKDLLEFDVESVPRRGVGQERNDATLPARG